MTATITDIGNGFELDLDNCGPLFSMLCYYKPAEIAAAIKVLFDNNKGSFTDQQHLLTALHEAFNVLQATPVLILETE